MELTWIKYPETDLVSTRGGSKVGFRTYSSKIVAMECCVAAENNATIRENQGHDFGYMWPGEMRETPEGFWEVTIP
jgi:hypothetical protein